MKDFTFAAMGLLYRSLLENGYNFITFQEYCSGPTVDRFVILRHDVDKNIQNAVHMAEFEHSLGITASYYFRTKNKVYDEAMIKKISSLSHEIGYHYEDLATAGGDMAAAIRNFEANLDRIRCLGPVKTICMHGSPMSRHDNRALWEQYSYRDYELIGEPYYDIDFSDVMYLTDTGRTWAGQALSVRDKVPSHFSNNIKTTFDIIAELEHKKMPTKLMLNIHPHRWAKDFFSWFKELIWQNFKNAVKFVLIKIKSG